VNVFECEGGRKDMVGVKMVVEESMKMGKEGKFDFLPCLRRCTFFL